MAEIVREVWKNILFRIQPLSLKWRVDSLRCIGLLHSLQFVSIWFRIWPQQPISSNSIIALETAEGAVEYTVSFLCKTVSCFKPISSLLMWFVSNSLYWKNHYLILLTNRPLYESSFTWIPLIHIEFYKYVHPKHTLNLTLYLLEMWKMLCPQ